MKKLTVMLGLFLSISIAAATDEAALLKAVRNFDFEDEIDTDILHLDKSIDIDGGYTVAVFYEGDSPGYGNNIIYLLKQMGSSYRALDMIIGYQSPDYNEKFYPITFLENAAEPADRLFVFGYNEVVPSCYPRDIYYYIVCRVKDDSLEFLYYDYEKFIGMRGHLDRDDACVWSVRDWRPFTHLFEYTFVDIGEELPGLLRVEYYREEDESFKFHDVRLFHYTPDGFDYEPRCTADDFTDEDERVYSGVSGILYSDKLRGLGGDSVKLLLANSERKYNYDVPAAIELYEEVAATTADDRIRTGVIRKIKELSHYKDDPKEAIVLFDENDRWTDPGYSGLYEQYPDSKVAGLARIEEGEYAEYLDFESYLDFVRKYPEHPDWADVVLRFLEYGVYKDEENKLRPEEVEDLVKLFLEDVTISVEYKVYACLYFGSWVQYRHNRYAQALDYFKTAYELSPDDKHKDCSTGHIALLYNDMGDWKNTFIEAVKVTYYSNRGCDSETLANIIGEYEIVDGDETTTLKELAADRELHFAVAQFDGEGDEEVLAWWIEWNPYRVTWIKILEFRGDKLHVAYTIPGGSDLLKVDDGLDMNPCVYTEFRGVSDGEISINSVMHGYYDGEYRELGNFDLSAYPHLKTPDEQWLPGLEMAEHGEGRIVITGEYYNRLSLYERDRYIFDEERAYFVKEEE